MAQLKDAGAELHVVSEGDSAIQRFKFDSLGLAELVEGCVVTDTTCGVLSILDELFQLHKDLEMPQVPSFVIELYDALAPFTIKSPASLQNFCIPSWIHLREACSSGSRRPASLPRKSGTVYRAQHRDDRRQV